MAAAPAAAEDGRLAEMLEAGLLREAEDEDAGGAGREPMDVEPPRSSSAATAARKRKRAEAGVVGYGVEALVRSLRARRGLSNDAAGEASELPLPLLTSDTWGRLPPELFPHILKYLSPEDLASCAAVCHALRVASSDNSLWRRGYCLRWGPPAGDRKGRLRMMNWKQLYYERDRVDMNEFVRDAPLEFHSYYVQIQAAKRSIAPLHQQVHDDLVVVESAVAKQISEWRRTSHLEQLDASSHSCNGRLCTYHQIGDVFLCEVTGQAHVRVMLQAEGPLCSGWKGADRFHVTDKWILTLPTVCDDTCREIVLDPDNELLVCAVSGRCFDRWITPQEEIDEGPDRRQAEVAGAPEEMEPFLGTARLARAYCLGYNCRDDEELDAALRSLY
eukprot:SM000003S11093  [mRNA]  locus=s3:814639:817933:+ [translate_table: standard]